MAEYDGYKHEQLEIKMMPPLEDTTHPNYVANPNVNSEFKNEKIETFSFKYMYKLLYFRFLLKRFRFWEDFAILQLVFPLGSEFLLF